MKTNTKQLAQLALLTAIILLMAFTPIGYIPIGPLNLTLIVIPVAIGAILLGPKSGAFLGGVFGITSIVRGFMGASPMIHMLIEINLAGAFITCVVARMLTGWLCGVLYQALHRTKTKKAAVWLANLSCPLLNTILFMSSLVLFFYQTDYIQGLVASKGAFNPIHFVLLLVGVNGLVEAITCFLVGSAVTQALLHDKT